MTALRGVHVVLCVVTLWSWAALVRAQPYTPTTWTGGAHATFYGGPDGSGTFGGACGYGNTFTQGYGSNTAALSHVLYNNGLTCGACFELQCVPSQSQYCYGGGNTVTVTATNYCPQGSNGAWCDYPNVHFDLAYAAFTQLAPAVAGFFPVQFKRVPCSKTGGIRFTLNGSPYYLSILVSNVGGFGDVQALSIKGSNSGSFESLTQNWGQVWSLSQQFVGQELSFGATVGDASFEQTLTFSNVVPSNWQFSTTYEANSNF